MTPALRVQETQDRFWGLAAIIFVIMLAVAAVGGWAYVQVRESLREVRAAGLNSLLEAETQAMRIWIDEKKSDAQRWASTPEVQRRAAGLVQLAARGTPPERLCASRLQQELNGQIAPYAKLEELVAFNLIGRDGTIIASPFAAYCGLSVRGGEFMKRLAPVFDGGTVFIRPWLDSERVGLPGAPLSRPLVWVETPVRGDDGSVIAALGFGRYAEDRFAKLLAITGASGSREAYAFDARGLMLTESRYRAKLEAAGLLAAGETGVLHLALRDPGGDLLAGFRPPPSAELPLTELARQAISGLASGGPEGYRGLHLEPYRNYRGAEVVGAWSWMPEKEMAIAVEIEVAEAYAPLRYLQAGFGVLFGFMIVSLLAAAGMSLWAARLRLREAKRVGQYTIEREIGEGGMSHVYLARHARLKRPTAVKVLKQHLANDEMVARFEREVQLCSQLTHPNTIEIYDYGRTRDGAFFYAMEFLDGISLEELVRRDGAMPVSRAVHALRQACASLREAHQHDLVHRDIKPQNLMLCRLGGQFDVLKVLDFGLVKEMHNPHTRDITQYAKVLGTPLYMAPERLRNPADADARADIYALGAVAHYVLTGRNLFEAQTDHDLVYQAMNAEPPSAAAHGAKDVPAVFENLLARCLAKDRAARPASIDEVDAILAELARQRPWSESDARACWQERSAALGIPEGARGSG